MYIHTHELCETQMIRSRLISIYIYVCLLYMWITGNNPVFLTLACFVELRAVAHVCVRGQDIVRNDYQRCHPVRALSARECARERERNLRARLQATCYTKPADSAVRAASARAETLQQCERDNERIHTHLHPPGDPLWPIDTSLTVTASVNFCTTILLISKIQHGISWP